MTNTLAMFVAEGIQPFLGIVLAFVISRYLGPEGFGKYNLLFQIYSIFQITCTLGLTTLMTREIASDRGNVHKYLTSGVLLGLPAALINILVVVVMVLVLQYESDVTTGSYLIAISLIAGGMTDILSAVLSGFEEVKKIAYAWLIFLIIKTTFSIGVLLAGYDLITVIAVHLVTRFFHTAITYWFVYKLIGRPKIIFDWQLSKKFIRMGWSLALLAILVSLFWRVDMIILSKMVDSKTLGHYGAAYRIYHILLMVVRSFALAFFPMISAMYTNRRPEFERACRKAIRYLTLLVIPIIVLTNAFAFQIMPLMWGAKFDNILVTHTLQAMAWALIPFAITEILGSALIASRNQTIHMVLQGITLGVKIILNYFLTLKYGIIGPAYATNIALVVLLCIQLPFVIPKVLTFRLKTAALPILKTGLALGLVGGVVYYVQSVYFLIGMPLVAAVYIACIFILKLFSNEDRAYFWRLIKKTA